MANTQVLTLSHTEANTIFEKYQSYATNTPPYALWQVKMKDCTITHYNSGKTVFQGSNIDHYLPFSSISTPIQSSTFPQAGSDEVGTGDYFGPIVVCAAIVDETNLELIKSLGVTDSKAMTDENILKVAPQLIEHTKHFVYTLPPEKYNEVHKTYNINAIKAIMHNACWLQLAKNNQLPSFNIVDQFTPESNYYRYLHTQKQVFKNLHFETKSEKKYPSVAAASVIARYTFLTYWKQMEEDYHMSFQKGAGAPTDKCIKDFVSKYPEEELYKVAKVHFFNTKNILHHEL